MEIGLVIIGSELLSGKRADQHQEKARKLFQQRGLDLDWVRYLNDSPPLIVDNLRETMARDALVFCFGGIGATPDDHTRACAAVASGRELCRHPEAESILREIFGQRVMPVRIRMADLPKDAELIPNPVNSVPGFSIDNHYFVPGFPSMAWPMMEWVLATHFPSLSGAQELCEQLIEVRNVPESELIAEMESLIAQFPNLNVSCLPHANDSHLQLELGLRGERSDVDSAVAILKVMLDARQLDCTILS
jgi:molybdopterin-biosynthesis enzyme MoeA-like protein